MKSFWNIPDFEDLAHVTLKSNPSPLEVELCDCIIELTGRLRSENLKSNKLTQDKVAFENGCG